MNRNKLKRAIQLCEGRISAIAIKMKCSKSVIYRAINEDPEMQMFIDQVREARNDFDDEREFNNFEQAEKNAAEWLRKKDSKASPACLTTSHLFLRRKWQSRDREKTFANFPGAQDIKLDIPGITDGD